MSSDKEDEPFILKDIWLNFRFTSEVMYPPRVIEFKSMGTPTVMHLQIPNQALRILRCVYGKWEVPSFEHAAPSDVVCRSEETTTV